MSWPAPPMARRIAVVSTRSGTAPVFDTWDRSLWLLTPGGRAPEELVSTPGFSYENPVWAVGGRSVLVVRRLSKPTASASICLVSVDRPGNCEQVADLGRVGFGYYGINGYGLDWYQPRS